MATFIRVLTGAYRNTPVTNMVFPLIKDYKKTEHNSFVTVDGSKLGHGSIRVSVISINDIVPATETDYDNQPVTGTEDNTIVPVGAVVTETDEEILARLAERFEVLDLMTKATIAGDARGLIVSGPPGVGKSFGVERELEKAGLFDQVAGQRLRYNIVKGAASALGLYAALYNFSDKGNVTVFDDCDGILQDELSLNLLKGALDSSKKRRLSWNSSRSNYLEEQGIPSNFLFKGAVIFITNIKLDNVRSKKIKDHLEALMSRCHYLDLTMDTHREKMLRIKQVADTGNLFTEYGFDQDEQNEVMNFMEDNKDNFREMSIRMALKISDLKKISPTNWKSLTRSTCMHRKAVMA